MVATLTFQKPTTAGTCGAGFTLATSYAIKASNSQFPTGHMFGSIAHVQGTAFVFPQQWPATKYITKQTTADGDKMSECVSGYPKIVNGY